MNLWMAAYDPAHASLNGNYWVWQHPRLTAESLNQLHAEFARSHLPAQPNLLTAAEVHGGCIGLKDGWCAIYRAYNGGRDLLGRPGRYLLLAAFFQRGQIDNVDPAAILEHGTFAEWARGQPLKGPGQPPHGFEDQFVDVKMVTAAAASVADTNVSESWRKCQQLPAEARFHWKFGPLPRGSTTFELAIADSPRTGALPGEIGPRESKWDDEQYAVMAPPLKSRVPSGKPFRRSMLALLCFAVGSAAGFAVGRLIPSKSGATASDRRAMLDWVKSYQSPETGRLIRREELIRRLKENDWRFRPSEVSAARQTLPHGPPSREGAELEQFSTNVSNQSAPPPTLDERMPNRNGLRNQSATGEVGDER